MTELDELGLLLCVYLQNINIYDSFSRKNAAYLP